MARALAPTLLPLDRYARIIGAHPLHFNQVVIGGEPTCGDVVYQYDWQNAGRTSRETIAQAIAQAEARIMDELGYPLLPTWVVEEEFAFFPRRTARWQGLVVAETRWGKFLAGGIKAQSAEELAAAVVYSDADSDGYDETATITFATTVTDPEELAVFSPGEGGAAGWEIRPVAVAISSGTATITCRREQLVKPELTEAVTINGDGGVEGTDDANFLTTVDVYRRHHDASVQAELRWQACGVCDGEGCEGCSYTTQAGCLRAVDPQNGIVIVEPGAWDDATSAFVGAPLTRWSRPERVLLSYRAGHRDLTLATPNVTMDEKLAQAVAMLATTYLSSTPCGCANKSFDEWSIDLALQESTQAESSSYKLSRRQIDNPFGTKVGAVRAWQLIAGDRIGQAVRVH